MRAGGIHMSYCGYNWRGRQVQAKYLNVTKLRFILPKSRRYLLLWMQRRGALLIIPTPQFPRVTGVSRYPRALAIVETARSLNYPNRWDCQLFLRSVSTCPKSKLTLLTSHLENTRILPTLITAGKDIKIGQFLPIRHQGEKAKPPY